MKSDLVYLNYWRRKELLSSKLPIFPLLKWWVSDDLCQSEELIYSEIRSRDKVLDVGAGDLKIMQKFHQAGYSGVYHTQDIGSEFKYDYASLDEIKHDYSAILCLDVIEHLPLTEGLYLIHQLIDLLSPDGVLIIQTPNARCVRNPLISDITHLHCYNLPDLWSYLTCMGLKVRGYRISFEPQVKRWIKSLSGLIGKYLITRVLGLDYADNIMIIAHKINNF